MFPIGLEVALAEVNLPPLACLKCVVAAAEAEAGAKGEASYTGVSRAKLRTHLEMLLARCSGAAAFEVAVGLEHQQELRGVKPPPQPPPPRRKVP